MIFYVKRFAIPFLGVIFVTLITSSVLSIAADDPAGNNVVSEDADKLNVVPTEDLKYEIYLHVLVRNADGELISVAECQFTNCTDYLAHEVTDYAFDTALGKKEIITIDNIKYEKVQFSDSSEQTMTSLTLYNQYMFDNYLRVPAWEWVIEVCGEPIKKYGVECTQIFWSRTSVMWLEVGDTTIANWTILRELN